MKRFLSIGLVVSLLVLTTGCPTIKTIEKGLVKISVAVGEIEKNANANYKSGLFSKETRDGLFKVCTKLNVAGDQAAAIVQVIKKNGGSLGYPDREKLAISLLEMANAVDPNAIAEIAGIDSPITKETIERHLIAIRAALSSISIIVAAGN
jgi:hypothetical protein